MQLKRKRSDFIKIVTTVDVVMTKETALPLAKPATDVVGRITMKRNANKNLIAGPMAMGGGIKVAKIYANAVDVKGRMLMKLVVKIVMMKVAVLAIATIWRIWLIRSNLFSITKTIVDR